MASEDVLNYVKVIGLFTAGIATGMNVCASYLAMPALLSPRSAPPRELQAQWNHLYDRGKFTLPPLSIIAGAAFSYVAYHDQSLRTPYTVAAVSVVGIIPFTLVGMRPNLRALLEKRAWVDIDKRNLRQLLHEWTVLNWVRATMLGVGFGTALVKTIC